MRRSTPTPSSWATLRRPPSWVGGRGTASSRSIRTWIGRDGYWDCWASPRFGRRRSVASAPATFAPPIQEGIQDLRRAAILPALNEQECIARVIEEIRAYDPGF